MNNKYIQLIIVFLLIAASIIAFGRIVNNDFINYDDGQYITENINIKSGVNFATIKWALKTSYFSYWHPLTWLSHTLDWSLFSSWAGGHHLVSLLFHIGAVLFLFLFLYKTTRNFWPSAIVAALFAIHPLRVESVAWAAERKDVLSMFFGMATLYAYAFYVQDRKISKYLLCFFLFVLALMSKPMMVTIPFVLLLVDYWPLERFKKVLNSPSVNKQSDTVKPKPKKKKKKKATAYANITIANLNERRNQIIKIVIIEKAPFLFFSIILSISLIIQQKTAGGMMTLEAASLSTRVANALVAYVAYLGKIFWPQGLAVFYPYEFFVPSWKVFISVVIVLLITATAISFAKKRPFLLFGWFWYLGTLFPVIGLLQAGSQAMADRYTYLPFIGIAIMLVWSLMYLLPKKTFHKPFLAIAVSLVIFILSFLTWQQCGYWRNSFSLFKHALNVTENNYIAHANLGKTYADQGNNAKALIHYYESIKIKPSFGHAHAGLAAILAEEGKYEEAIFHYITAIRTSPHPDYDMHYNLAILYQQTGDINQAIEQYREALRINPNYSSAHLNLGTCLGIRNEYDGAIYHFRKALRLDPADPGIYFNIGLAQLNKEDFKSAADSFKAALRLNPNFEEANYGLHLALDMDRRSKR
ncbi:MAG TPA: tetratricopeptide repeat protein [Deltaproteobacteria bacterium]|nr:tetratricopeptide repeat protein [Deltaproteobacteria bacterium]